MGPFLRTSVLLISLTLLRAGTYGKLSGVVTSTDGEPLVGVNVLVAGTGLGTASNARGEYFILNLTPGPHTIVFSAIGYKTARYENVILRSQFTTFLKARLEPTVLSGEEVVVTAPRPPFQKDATSRVVVVDAEEIINLPVADFKDILVTQAGFSEDAGGGIHVRGGRTREILYLVDGMVVRDPLLGDFTGSLNQNAIQEMSVISGTFNAEYGEAMSGVVSIVTKEGSRELHGKAEFISDRLNASPYHAQGAFPAVRDSNYRHVDLRRLLLDVYPRGRDRYPATRLPLLDLPLAGTANLTLSGMLPLPRSTFFASALYRSTTSPLPHGFEVEQDIQLKLTQRLTPQIKLTEHLQSSLRLGQSYSHPWKYQPQHQAHTFRAHERVAVGLTHAVAEPVFYTLVLSRYRAATRVGVQDKTPDEYVRPLTDATVYFYNSLSDTAAYSGDQGTYTDNNTRTDALKFDLTWQMNHRHLLKTGLQRTAYTLDIHTVEEPWPGGTNFSDDTTFTPAELAVYLQDKIEYDYLIMNLGLRYDRLEPNAAMWADVTRFVVWDSTAEKWTPAPVTAVPARPQWSPRLGLAFPVTERTVFHFSYGHFFQNPTYDAITYNARKDISSTLPLVGNPRVKPQKTVAFETGLKHAFARDFALEVSAWTKDIRDLLSTQQIRYLSSQYVLYTNSDYASVKGLDISLHRRGRGLLGGSLAYTLSMAKGNNSNPIAGYFNAYAQEEVPHQEYFLSFDQRHDFAVTLNLRIPERFGIPLGKGYPLGNLNANLLVNTGSGLPYTPYVDPAFRVDVNSARKPWVFSADLRLKKIVALRSADLVLLCEVTNLTDYRNVRSVYSRTGKPFDPGFSGVGTSADTNHNPAHLGPGRAWKAGFYVEW